MCSAETDLNQAETFTPPGSSPFSGPARSKNQPRGRKKNHMNPLNQLKPTTAVILIGFLVVCFGALNEAHAVITDPEDYFPGGNTAAGQGALLNVNLDQGQFNTAIGLLSLSGITEGDFNTGVGAATLFVNTANNNTATGAAALFSNTIGEDNTANGVAALARNIEGSWNTAFGSQALTANTGYDNTAIGFQALSSNTDGSSNIAVGRNALLNTTLGTNNTCIGRDALLLNTIGGNNTGVGFGSLQMNTSGTQNIGLGSFAGFNVTTAFNVIAIGSLGANVNFSTWIDNIYGITPQSGTTVPVVVSDGGQLGTVASAARFKQDIATMDKTSEIILSLRPVTFHYKTDARKTPQFGLIAEEVAKVNPALVLPDKDGKPFTVRYDAVNAMLLNEFLKEHRKVEKLEAALRAVNERLSEQDAKIQKVSAQLKLSQSVPRTVLNNQ